MASSRRRKRVVEIENRGGWKRLLVKIILSLIVVVILALVGGYYYFNSYLQGDEFRALIQNKMGKNIGAEVSVSPLKRDGKYLLVNSLALENGEGLVKNAEISGVELEFDYNRLWEREVYLDRIYVRDVSVDIDISKKVSENMAYVGVVADRPEVIEVPAIEEDSLVVSPGKSVAWYKRFVPNKFGFSLVQVDKLSLGCVLPQGTAQLSNVQVNVTSKNQAAGTYKVGLKGGNYEIPGKFFTKGELDVASFRYSPELFSISEFKLKVGSNGRLAAEGEVGLGRTPSDLNISLQGIELKELLPANWARSVEGVMKATGKVKRDAQGEISCKGEVSFEKAVVTALPLLDTLAAFANTGRFRRVEWTLAQSKFSKEGDVIAFRDIFLASEGLVRLEGWVEIRGEALSGKLMVGIPAGLLAHIPGAEETIFTKENNQGKMNLLWTPITLSGTLDSPKEDLSRRLLMAAGERILRKLPGGKQVLNFSESVADRLLNGLSSGSGKEKDDSGKEGENEGKPKDDSIKVGRDLLQMGLEILK